eukprot:1738714-Rhodomonas_salina.2
MPAASMTGVGGRSNRGSPCSTIRAHSVPRAASQARRQMRRQIASSTVTCARSVPHIAYQASRAIHQVSTGHRVARIQVAPYARSGPDSAWQARRDIAGSYVGNHVRETTPRCRRRHLPPFASSVPDTA